MGADIRKKSERGVFSQLLSTVGNRVVHAFSTVVLMRLMGPEQFGIIGFAVIFKELVLLFSSWGVGDAVIQKRGKDDLVAAGQLLSVARSLTFFVLLFIAAPFAATFFETPEVKIVVRVSALLLLIGPIGFVPRLRMQIELHFTMLAVISFLGALVNAAVAISSAMAGLGYLSIVYGNVAGAITGLLGAWIAQPGIVNPRKATRKGMREILGFGYNITLSGLVSWIYLNIDDLIVGKLLGRTVLGLYTKAYWMATLPSETLGRILYNVTFPVYVRLKDDYERLTRAFLEVYTMNVFLSLPAIIGILVLSSKIVPIVFGPEWVGMIGILEATCIVGLLRAIYGQANSVFKAVGRPDYFWKAALVQAGIVVTLGYWATTIWGVYGMLGALVVAMSWGFVVYSYLAFYRVLRVPVVPYLASLRPIILSTAAMGIFTYLARPMVSDFYTLIGLILTSAALYFILVYLLGGRNLIDKSIGIAKRITGRE